MSRRRIVCPRDLDRDAYYTACVVPAFVVDADGTLHDAWSAAAGPSVSLPCYDAWSFRTGPEGDFPQLAAKLRAADTARLAQHAFGRAEVKYERRGTSGPSSAKHLDRRRAAAARAARRPSVVDNGSPPRSPRSPEPVPHRTDAGCSPRRTTAPFVAPGTTPTAGGWSEDLTEDPRCRGAAGLGAWAAIAWQDAIARAAAAKAGDLAIARDRVGALALGVEASRSLWRRRVPTDPVAQLAVLAPVLGRFPVAGGGTVLDAIAGRTPLLARALFSSATRRALRPGPARSALAQPGASRFEAVLRHASRCPGRPRDPDAIPVGRNVDANAQLEAARAAILAAGASDPDFARRVADRALGSGTPPSPSLLAAILAALDPGGRARPDRDAVMRIVDSHRAPPLDLPEFSACPRAPARTG